MNAVTDPDYADEATGAESSSHEGEDTQMRRQEQSLSVMKERIPDLSLPMMKHE